MIDVQQILCSGGNRAHDVDGVITRCNLISSAARKAGALVVVIQHETTGGDMDYGTTGWQLAPTLETSGTDVYVRKTTCDSFLNTALHETLQSRGITDVVICGLQSEFCVDTTTRRAMALGYPVILVSDGHSTVDNGVLSAAQISAHHNQTLSNLESFGPRTIVMAAADVRFQA